MGGIGSGSRGTTPRCEQMDPIDLASLKRWGLSAGSTCTLSWKYGGTLIGSAKITRQADVDRLHIEHVGNPVRRQAGGLIGRRLAGDEQATAGRRNGNGSSARAAEGPAASSTAVLASAAGAALGSSTCRRRRQARTPARWSARRRSACAWEARATSSSRSPASRARCTGRRIAGSRSATTAWRVALRGRMSACAERLKGRLGQMAIGEIRIGPRQ